MKAAVVFIILIVLNLIGNILAQRLLPTFSSDSFMRRVGYRFVFVGVLLLSLVLLLPIAMFADYLSR